MIPGAGKLDPTQQDRWWRSRIGKETAFYDGKAAEVGVPGKISTISLNPLGTLTILDVQHNDNVHSGIAVMRSPRSPAPSIGTSVKQASPRASPRAPESIAFSRAGSTFSHRMGQGSTISYPRTPQFSQAGSGGSAVDGEIMDRLSKLEQDLTEERHKRQAAQDEMKELLSKQSSRMGTPAGHR